MALHTHPEETFEYFRDIADCSDTKELIMALKEKTKDWQNDKQ